ncbi:MAG: pro-sigmaK processing inhibitor BofA family protein [Firmicutes bacterium]|nr:pro-sigmaK processing inhibitor BofA family protein [Bacillota bacterium]
MMEMGILLAFAFGMIGMYLLAWILLVPMKFVGKMMLNSILGAVFLIVLNGIGSVFGIHISLNLLTAGIVGVFGLPGVILCLVLF